MTVTLLATDADNIRQVIIALAKLSIVLVLVIIAISVIRWAFTYDRRVMEKGLNISNGATRLSVTRIRTEKSYSKSPNSAD